MNDPALACRVAAVAFFSVASSLAVHAQQATGNSADPAAGISFATPVPAFCLASEESSLSGTVSSSADGMAASPSSVPVLDLSASGLQPPPRRSYGRPRYNDSAHNPDGSKKYVFEGEVGASQPLGNTFHYDKLSYAVGFGAGRRFNKNVAVLAKFDWDNFGLEASTLQNQTNLYNYLLGSNGPLGSLDGSAHVWSFTLNPMYNFLDGEKYGAYVVVGGGYYHKVTTFTTPEEVSDGAGFVFAENATFDHYTSNAGGANGGFGVTYKPSKFANEVLFVEARYVFVANQHRPGITAATPAATINAYTGSNFYPANSNRTTFLPIEFGLRF